MRARSLGLVLLMNGVVGLVACREEPGVVVPRDMSGGGGTADLSVRSGADLSGEIRDMTMGGGDAPTAVKVTVPELYMNSAMYENKRVTIEGVVVTGLVRNLGPSNAGRCRYEAYVQPAGNASKKGVRLYASGDMCVQQDGGRCQCPFAPKSNTKLDFVEKVGDIVTVTGFWDVYTPPAGDAGVLPTQHELSVSFVSKTGGGGMVDPTVVTDLATFQPYAGGWAEMESGLVTIKAAQATSIGLIDAFGNWNLGGVPFTDSYEIGYSPPDGGMFPAPNSMFTAISGVATLPFGGVVLPRLYADFVR